jgi:hypothetical protein
MDLCVGVKVELHSLTMESMNGRLGTILNESSEAGRWVVKLASGERVKIKATNLVRVSDDDGDNDDDDDGVDDEAVDAVISAALEEGNRNCAYCFEIPAVLLKCGRCKEIGYCGRDCQVSDWKNHKPNCGSVGAMRTLLEMGRSDPEQDAIKEKSKVHNKMLRNAKKAGMPIITCSYTSFGIVAPGMPIPAGVPPNFALKQAAVNAFQTGFSSSGTGRGNFKGEGSYREFYDDLEDNKEQWMSFFDVAENYEHAEHSCGILGTLATVYRQRGALEDCEKVLDMEDQVLIRYQRASEGTCSAQVNCCDTLTFKCQTIRYNMCFQTQRYEECYGLFRKLAAYELKYEIAFDHQSYLFMLVIILKKKPTAAVLKSLTDTEIHKIVVAPLNCKGGGDPLESKQATQKTALQTCAKCGRKENYISQFKKCTQCKVTYYCGRDCQKDDWKAHKKACSEFRS